MSTETTNEQVVEDVTEAVEDAQVDAETTTVAKTEADSLRLEVTTLTEKVAELEDSLLRSRAEVENFKRRTRQEFETNLKFANQSLIEQFLPVLDAFDRALDNQNTENPEVKQFLKGFEMIQSLVYQTLENAGLQVIKTVGEQFDPYLHQSVLEGTDEEKEENEILEELQRGYTLKDRVIRASMVKINRK